MYSKFNMGMGFFIVCEKDDSDDILQKVKGKLIGEVKKANKTRTVMKDLVFEGY